MTSINLAGQLAVVTGGARGIGRAIAERLYGAGASVAILDLLQEPARAAAQALGDRAAGFGCDVTDRAQVEQAVAQAEQLLGPTNILVNNAGVTRDNILIRLSDADWDAVMNANLKGAFHITRAVVMGMMKRRSGRIINIASVVGLIGNKGQANYAASKAGLIGFTKSVAREYASRNVLANCIAPGFIETDMTAALSPESRQALFGQIALGRLGQPADVAGVVLFLASELASYITGQVLVVDGGMVF